MRGFSRLGEKKIDRELKFNKFRAPSTPDLSRLNAVRHGRALRAAAARAATLEDSTPTRTHAHHTNRRGVFYISIERFSFPTNRP